MNDNSDLINIAQNFLASDEGMQDIVIELLMPKILDSLKSHGIEPGHQQSTNGVHNTNGQRPDDPIPFPNNPEVPQQQMPQQKLQMEQVMNLLQVLGPYLGPLLGLTPQSNDNTDSFEKGMRIFSQYDAIKESGKREYVELLSTLTGNLTNRTDRDPAEVMGQIAQIELDKNEPGS